MNTRKIKHNSRTGEILSGQVLLRAEGELQVEFPGHPENVSVRFEDNQNLPIPCTPQKLDRLDYKIIHTELKTILFIYFSVESARAVVYTARY